MILTDESGKMIFNFDGFNIAEHYDTSDNKCDGLKIVDFFAENEESCFFIEAKNYVKPPLESSHNKYLDTAPPLNIKLVVKG